MVTMRVAKRERFTVVDRRAVNDDRLSYRARGILFWLLDKPDDWTCDSASIARQGTSDDPEDRSEGRDAVRAALTELERHGYLERHKRHDAKGQWSTEVIVHEVPGAWKPVAGSTSDGKPDDGKPGVGELGVEVTITKTDNGNRTPLTPRKRGEPCSGEDVEQFESFWRSWLDICNARGVPCGSKQNAAIRWGAAPTASGRRSKSRLTRDDRTAVMASFEEWKIYYSDPRSQTPPHAVTWLNQRRWETPPPKAGAPSTNGTAVADRALISELGTMVRKFTPVKGYAMFVERHGPLTEAQWVLYDSTYPNQIYRVARDVTVPS